MLDPLIHVTRLGDLPEERFDWGTLQWLCSGKLFSGAAQTLGLCRLLPGRGNPLHYHPNCEEVLHVIVGRGNHRLADRWIELGTGDTLRIPTGVRHQFVNQGDETLVCLIAFSSGDRQTVFLE